jgi:hypothetical protein
VAYRHTNSKGVSYYLNAKKATLRGGKTQTIYYFSHDERAETGVDLPHDRIVNENPANGFLSLSPTATAEREYELTEAAGPPVPATAAPEQALALEFVDAAL